MDPSDLNVGRSLVACCEVLASLVTVPMSAMHPPENIWCCSRRSVQRQAEVRFLRNAFCDDRLGFKKVTAVAITLVAITCLAYAMAGGVGSQRGQI